MCCSITFLIKPNNHELGEIVGRTLTTDADITAAARTLQEKGARNVLVSMAGDGALLLDEKGEVHRIGTPKGKVVNSVGAGDSMVAGFVAGYLRSGSYLEACVWVPPAAVPLRSASGWQRRKRSTSY